MTSGIGMSREGNTHAIYVYMQWNIHIVMGIWVSIYVYMSWNICFYIHIHAVDYDRNLDIY